MNLKKKLKAFFTMKRRANDGFTLVELIVVIAILAILAGVAIPVYSGYIKKAEAAADEQLLAAVNTAFAAACMQNGADPCNLDSKPTITLAGSAGAKTVQTVSLYNEEFAVFFAGNESSAFKAINALRYDSNEGKFVKYESDTYQDGNGNTWYYDQSVTDAYNKSNFGDVEDLMGTVDGLVTGVMNNNQSIGSLKNSAGFAAFLTSKGIDPNNAGNQEIASALATYTAQSLSGVDAEALYNTIAGAKDADGNWNYTTALNNISKQLYGSEQGQFANKAASAAILYSLATSFKNSEQGFNASIDGGGTIDWDSLDNSQVSDSAGFNSYMDTVSTPEFDAYIKQDGLKDIEALLGAFGVVNDNYDVIEDYRQQHGGYDNDDITDTINSILGRK